MRGGKLRVADCEAIDKEVNALHGRAMKILKEEVKKVCDRYGYSFGSGHTTGFTKNGKDIENVTTEKVIYLVVDWYRDTLGTDCPNFFYENGVFLE